jgi:hypothetical protein
MSWIVNLDRKFYAKFWSTNVTSFSSWVDIDRNRDFPTAKETDSYGWTKTQNLSHWKHNKAQRISRNQSRLPTLVSQSCKLYWRRNLKRYQQSHTLQRAPHRLFVVFCLVSSCWVREMKGKRQLGSLCKSAKMVVRSSGDRKVEL